MMCFDICRCFVVIVMLDSGWQKDCHNVARSKASGAQDSCDDGWLSEACRPPSTVLWADCLYSRCSSTWCSGKWVHCYRFDIHVGIFIFHLFIILLSYYTYVTQPTIRWYYMVLPPVSSLHQMVRSALGHPPTTQLKIWRNASRHCYCGRVMWWPSPAMRLMMMMMMTSLV